MTRHSFIWSLLAMVLAPLAIPGRRPVPPKGDIWVYYGRGGKAHFTSLSAAMDTVEASGKDVIWVYPCRRNS